MSDVVRRIVTVVVVALALLSVPQLAVAAFSDSEPASLAVGTASMVAPSGVQGSYRCLTSGRTEGLQVSVTDFTDGGPSGASYVFTVLKGTAVQVTKTQTAKAITLTTPYAATDNKTTVYTLTVQSTLKSWTSPAFTSTISC